MNATEKTSAMFPQEVMNLTAVNQVLGAIAITKE